MIGTSLARAVGCGERRLVVGGHSGRLRAVVAWAAGEDLGEPDNGDEVVLTVSAGDDVVTVAYAGRSWRARVPATASDWSVSG